MLAPEAVMVDGVGDTVALAEVVPTAVVATVVAPPAVAVWTTAGAVVLTYTGADVGTLTTAEVVTGLTMVHGQLVMVKVWLAVTV